MNGGILSDVKRAFPDAVMPDCETYYGSVIAQCNDIYRGEPPWAYVKRSGLYGKGERRMNMLYCAKVLCDTMASLTFCGQADIFCGNEGQQKYVENVLRENNFWEAMPAFFSRAYALGGGVLKIFADGGRVCIDFVDADCFIPTGCGAGGINEGIFRSCWQKNGVCYTLLERQYMKDGHAAADRALFTSGLGAPGRQVPMETLFEGLEEHSEYEDFTEPMFAYFRPAAANNLAEGSLLGISCFANCTDTLKAIDIAFDSLSREFILGRKRIIVPSSCIRTVVDPDTGAVSRYFDADDEVYQALKCDEERDLKISDNTTELRVSEHVDAIKALLDILCFQTGLSSGSLALTGSSGVKTAAEIKSIETRTELTMQQNRNLAAELIEKTVRSIIRFGMMTGALEKGNISVRIAFSDRQTVDKGEIIEQNIRLVEAGLKSKVSALMAITDCTEEEARRELERVRTEQL
ncbi:MAG: phage portal protein [Huintestinicola sp.]